MKKLAYLDCVTGIAGDMCLGALVHAGVPLDYLRAQLERLGIGDEFELVAEVVRRNGQAATKASVNLINSHEGHNHEGHNHEGHNHEGHNHEGHSHKGHSHRTHNHKPHGGRRLPEIERLIEGADLPGRATAWSLAVFRLLAKAEAGVHGIPPEQVHFHEVGATDAIVDIVGTCLGLDWLEVDGLVCSPLPTGSGTVRCEHGLLPVPVPAVLSMMAAAQIPVYSSGIAMELVTPTGCAIAATLSGSFGPPPTFALQKIGLGAGGRDLKLPNILRLWIGTVEELPESALIKIAEVDAPAVEALQSAEALQSVMDVFKNESVEQETITVLQTQLDDLSPQVIGYAFDLLFAAGAVDVFAQSILMKKNRPGTLLTVLCAESAVEACEAVLFRETTTLGIRRTRQNRAVLDREMVEVETPYGAIAVKVGRADGTVLNVQPEFEDCARGARSHGVSLLEVQRGAIAAAAFLWD